MAEVDGRHGCVSSLASILGPDVSEKRRQHSFYNIIQFKNFAYSFSCGQVLPRPVQQVRVPEGFGPDGDLETSNGIPARGGTAG